jgi:hypothetical protein
MTQIELKSVSNLIKKLSKNIDEFRLRIENTHAVRLKEKVDVQPTNDVIPANVCKLLEMEENLTEIQRSLCIEISQIADYWTRMCCHYRYLFGYNADQIGKKFNKSWRWVYKKLDNVPRD